MIFKIQKPISSTEEIPEALIYNQSRSIFFQRPFSEVAELFEKNELKIYVRGKVINNILHIDRKLRPRDW
jgi:hypothetical protein